MDARSLGIKESLEALDRQMEGEVRRDGLHRRLYAQDASVYQVEPLAVVFPRHAGDVQAIVQCARELGVGITPRSGGTSLAGQTVGPGLVMDVGRHMNQILEINQEERWVRVQPGVILDELNAALAPYGLFFGPDTSTSNRCMIGGMIGNNSCGSHSIMYGTTRDHVLEMEVVLGDGERHRVSASNEVDDTGPGVLAQGVRELKVIAAGSSELIAERYPHRDVVRRNTGYPLDELVDLEREEGRQEWSMPRFLAGTEGTLAITTEAKLNLVDRPTHSSLVCVHFEDLESALKATVVAVEHDPAAVELIDRRVLEETKKNLEQARNRFWVQGDPGAVLVVEFYRHDEARLRRDEEALIEAFEELGLGYAYPVVRPPEDKAVWELRKAGLGLLMGIEGDVKPVTVVEDTAVAVDVLPDYIADFAGVMDAYDTACVYYAHASVGELHLRPELNLKDPEDVERFKGIARDVADLVKRYQGSLSGEHGDGRVRSPLLERFYGSEVMALHRRVKEAFDPEGIFNPGNIVDPEPIDAHFRFEPGEEEAPLDTYFKWREERGLLRATEMCNGAGVCRKKVGSGGTMCPSYMATLEEKDSTRGRANTFRSLLSGDRPQEAFESEELEEALDLCLSCKACKSECPASVDMAKMKAEYLQQRYDREGVPLSARFFAYFARLARLGRIWVGFSNFILSLALTRWLLEKVVGVSRQRQLPSLARRTFDQQFKAYRKDHPLADDAPGVWLYVDPITDLTEPDVAMAAVEVLEAMGYGVERFPIEDDGRTYISKGLVAEAKERLERSLEEARERLEAEGDRPIVGLEPSALLTMSDEWLDLLEGAPLELAEKLAPNTMLFEQFICQASEQDAGSSELFGGEKEQVVLHGHCHQKSLVGMGDTVTMLTLAGYEVELLDTGCCGMAGSFGYEKDHYDLSMQIGELVLFPELRERDESLWVAAPGTSCRDQIDAGVGREAHHPAVLMARRLKD